MEQYFKNQTFYKIRSQSIIDNPDQRIVDDLSSFTGTALAFSLTVFNVAIGRISFSNIVYGIYPPLFVVLHFYSIGGTAISIFVGKGLVNVNFMQEKKEAHFDMALSVSEKMLGQLLFMVAREMKSISSSSASEGLFKT